MDGTPTGAVSRSLPVVCWVGRCRGHAEVEARREVIQECLNHVPVVVRVHRLIDIDEWNFSNVEDKSALVRRVRLHHRLSTPVRRCVRVASVA